MSTGGLKVNIPVAWLTAVWWDELGLAGRGAYVSALAYSMGQGLDGDIPGRSLRFVDADTQAVADALDRAVKLGRVERTNTGWRFVDWEGLQEQTAIETIEKYRERKRDNQRRSRSRQAESVAGNVTGHMTGNVNKARRSKEITNNPVHGDKEQKATEPVTEWPVVTVPE